MSTEKRKLAAAIHAYISGPSGVGKTTQAGRMFPSDRFHHLRSDDYRRIEKTPQGIKRHFNWEQLKADADAANKPVVIDSMSIHPPLAAAAKRKILLETSEKTITQRRLKRGKPMDLDPEETRKAFSYYENEVKPAAERLGFKIKQASVEPAWEGSFLDELTHILRRYHGE
jgi:hypothetical protein